MPACKDAKAINGKLRETDLMRLAESPAKFLNEVQDDDR
jgi:hypothetical protein